MNPEERESLIEKVAKRHHAEGIDRLKISGNFQKYTPLFHFQICEPWAFENKDPFIFVTELFGNTRDKEFIPETFEGYRKQYHATYEGLNQIVMIGISTPHIKPYEKIHPTYGKIKTILDSPTRQIIKPTKEDTEAFDNSLLYLNKMTEYLTPAIFHLDSGHEFFSSTFYI